VYNYSDGIDELEGTLSENESGGNSIIAIFVVKKI